MDEHLDLAFVTTLKRIVLLYLRHRSVEVPVYSKKNIGRIHNVVLFARLSF
jgi:hypothetical protein